LKPTTKKFWAKDNGIEIQTSPVKLETCPECGDRIRAKGLHEGGGIVCLNPECGYWFCF
jgi:hypothetical protein